MNEKNEKKDYLPPEYPFGFGFALMKNPRAMQNFAEMSEWQKRELGRKLQRISSEQELRKMIEELE